ncbi:MAG: DUF1697 domain-containing protein [Bacillota bacterium]
MEKYIALLRGVNVGGKNKVPMPILKTAFEEAGFFDVCTYINSGNVIFSSKEDDISALQQACRQTIIGKFQMDIPVAVISASDLSDALCNAPEWWDNDRESKNIAVFMIAPAVADSLVKEVGLNHEYEKVSTYGQVIFWSAAIKTFSRTKWSSIIATPAYSCITIRNANTTKKLLELSKPQSS